MAQSLDLVFRFLGVDAGAGPEFDRMAGKASLATKALGGLALGAAGAAAGVTIAAVKMAGDFQTQMERIHTQANQSNKTVAALSKGILNMAGAVASTPGTLAAAAYHIASIGQHSLTTAQQLQVLKIATEGAKIGGADLVDVTNALDAAIVSHIRGVKNYSQAMGVLNSTVGAGDMTMQDLAEAFGPLGAVLKGYNVTIQQAGAALATFGDNNLRGAHAGTALRMAVQALAVPTSNGAAQLQQWGIKAGNLSKQLEHGGLTSALDTLMKKMRENGVTAKDQGTILTEAFGKRAGIGLAVLMGQLDRYHNKLGEVTDGGNNFARSWQGYTKTFGFALDSARASAETLLIELGTKLLPVATKFTNWLAQVAIPDLGKFGLFVKQVSGVFNSSMSSSSGKLSEFQNAIQAFVTLATDAWRVFGHTIVSFLKSTMKDVGEIFKGGLLVLTGILDVIDGILTGHWSKAWTGMKDIFVGVWDVIKGAAKGVLGLLKFQIGSTLDAIKGIWDRSWNAIERGFGDVVGGILQGFKFMVSGALAFMGAFINAGAKAFGWVPFVGGKLKGAAKAFDNFKTSAISSLTNLTNEAYGLGEKTGKSLSDGVAAGIAAHKARVLEAAGTLTAQAAANMNRAIRAASPSKVTMQTGKNMADGLVLGLQTSKPKVLEAAGQVAKLLAEGMIGGWSGQAARLKGAFSTGIQNMLSNFTTQLKAALAKQEQALKTAQSNLASFLKTRAQNIASLQSTIAGNADVSGVLNQSLTVGSQSISYTGNLGSYLSGQAGLLKREAGMFNRLRKMGLSPTLLSQISALAPTDAITIMQQILSGQDGSIASLNRSENLIQTYAKQTATRAIETPHEKQQLQHLRHLDHVAQRQLHEQQVTNRKLEHLAASLIASKTTVYFNGSSFKVTDEKDMRQLLAELKKLERKGVKLH